MATRASIPSSILVGLLAISPLVSVLPLHAQALLKGDARTDLPACADHEAPRRAVASGTFPRPCTVYYYPYPQGPRFSSLYVWGDTGWYSVGSGLSDLFPLAPGQSRYPYPAIPPGYIIRPRIASTRTFAARPLPSNRAPRPSSSTQAPWAAAAQRQTNPQRWRFTDEAGPSAANARALTVSRAGTNSRSLAAARSASAGSRQRVQRTSAARSSHARYRQRH